MLISCSSSCLSFIIAALNSHIEHRSTTCSPHYILMVCHHLLVFYLSKCSCLGTESQLLVKAKHYFEQLLEEATGPCDEKLPAVKGIASAGGKQICFTQPGAFEIAAAYSMFSNSASCQISEGRSGVDRTTGWLVAKFMNLSKAVTNSGNVLPRIWAIRLCLLFLCNEPSESGIYTCDTDNPVDQRKTSQYLAWSIACPSAARNRDDQPSLHLFAYIWLIVKDNQ